MAGFQCGSNSSSALNRCSFPSAQIEPDSAGPRALVSCHHHLGGHLITWIPRYCTAQGAPWNARSPLLTTLVCCLPACMHQPPPGFAGTQILPESRGQLQERHLVANTAFTTGCAMKKKNDFPRVLRAAQRDQQRPSRHL